MQRQHGRYTLSTDPARVDVEAVHRFLSESSYWALGRPLAVQASAIANSPLVVGAYLDSGADEGGAQVGFARMVTDLATFAWLADVYVLDEHRGCGLGTAMVQLIVEHPDVSGVALQFLGTADAHGLYARFGYEPLAEPARWMLRRPVGGAPNNRWASHICALKDPLQSIVNMCNPHVGLGAIHGIKRNRRHAHA